MALAVTDNHRPVMNFYCCLIVKISQFYYEFSPIGNYDNCSYVLLILYNILTDLLSNLLINICLIAFVLYVVA